MKPKKLIKIIYPKFIVKPENDVYADECVVTITEKYININVKIDGAGNTFKIPFKKIKEQLEV